jgi:hypothetical protein
MDSSPEATAVPLPYQKAKLLVSITPGVSAGRLGWIAPDEAGSPEKPSFLFSLASNPDLTFRVYEGEFSLE